jgi:hypothetical protein
MRAPTISSLSRVSDAICEPSELPSYLGSRCQKPSPCRWKKGKARLPGRTKGRTRSKYLPNSSTRSSEISTRFEEISPESKRSRTHKSRIGLYGV